MSHDVLQVSYMIHEVVYDMHILGPLLVTRFKLLIEVDLLELQRFHNCMFRISVPMLYLECLP